MYYNVVQIKAGWALTFTKLGDNERIASQAFEYDKKFVFITVAKALKTCKLYIGKWHVSLFTTKRNHCHQYESTGSLIWCSGMQQ